jgi:RimJ/RimL family protein N-acetyltransferase
MIGFTFYGIDEDDHDYWIYLMMIDQKYQGKGYGKQAIKLVIEDIRKMKKMFITPLHFLMNRLMNTQNASMRKWVLKK